MSDTLTITDTTTELPVARRRGRPSVAAIERVRATPDLWTTGVFGDFSRSGAEQPGFVPVMSLALWILDRP